MADLGGEASAAATMKSDLDATKAGAADTVAPVSSGGAASSEATVNGSTADGADGTDGSANVRQGSATDGSAAATTAAAATTSGSGDAGDGGEAGGVRRANAQGSFYGDASVGPDGAAEEEEAQDEEDDDGGQWERVAASDVKNIILQTLSPYFDDDVGGGAAAVPGVDMSVPASAAGQSATKPGSGATGQQRVASAAPIEEERAAEDTAQRYDHAKAEEWIALVCDGIMERLVALGKPFKFVVHSMVMRKSGAGVHVCSSCYYAPTDGWLSHAHDLSAHLYAVVTVYWCAV